MISRNVIYLLIAVLFMLLQGCSEGQLKVHQSAEEQFIDSLLSQLSLEEKAGQMTNISLMALAKGEFWMHRDTVELNLEKMQTLLIEKKVGSVQNLGTYPFAPSEWRKLISILHKFNLENNEHPVPILYGIDAVHGANYTAGSTIFPHQLALAATWNTDLAENCGAVTSYEMKASGIPWNYAPVLDVSKQPLWGRIFESFGEDTYLAGRMGDAFIRGTQGDDMSSFDKTGVCLKHFIGYGMPYNGKDRSPTYLPERWVRQYLLPPFQSAIENGALTVMLNSGSLNGVPSHIDSYWIQDVLKGELAFEGFTISDWEDVMNLVKTHEVAHDEKEAVKLAVNAGMDMCMEPYDASFADYVVDLVKEGEITQARIDDAVRRILRVKYRLGLFEKTLEPLEKYPDFASEQFIQNSYESAAESITLLKNEDKILPLSKGKKILLTGVSANSINYLNGAWTRTWGGEDTTFNDPGKETILSAIRKRVGSERLIYSEGTGYTEDLNTQTTLQKAKNADVIIVCLGEKPATEKPGDIDNLEFPEVQLQLVEKLSKLGKPIILTIVSARPRIFNRIEALADGILMCYLPGNEGGRAIAGVLFGEVNPSGKLPLTYPRHSGSLWWYDHKKSDTRDAGFGFEAFNPQYEFGYGLSYTDFEYSDLRISADTFGFDDSIDVSVKLSNTGDRRGKEVVQLFYKDEVASISPAVKQLCRFSKPELEAGESKMCSFKIHARELSFVNRDNQWTLEEGYFQLMVDTLSIRFYLKENQYEKRRLP